MKKMFAVVTAALAILSFSAVVFAAEPAPTMPPGHPPIGDQSAQPAKPAKKKKAKKAKKAEKAEKKEEKKEEGKPAEAPAAK